MSETGASEARSWLRVIVVGMQQYPERVQGEEAELALLAPGSRHPSGEKEGTISGKTAFFCGFELHLTG